jgi:hypothetical protein
VVAIIANKVPTLRDEAEEEGGSAGDPLTLKENF